MSIALLALGLGGCGTAIVSNGGNGPSSGQDGGGSGESGSGAAWTDSDGSGGQDSSGGGASSSGSGASGDGGADSTPGASGNDSGIDGGASNTDGAGGEIGPNGFVHPGVQVNRGMLDFVKAKIAAGEEPWKSALAAMSASTFASATYKPAPLAHVICGSYSNPDIGCTAEKNDSAAAYTQALLFYFTGNQASAQKAIEIMNAWSAVVQTHANNNASIESGWTSSLWTRAAEIIRYSNAGWSSADAAQFGTMLKNAYVPYIIDGEPHDNGNHEESDIEGVMGIAVFVEDMAMFQKSLAMWRARVPSYFYLTTDGPTPVLPPGGVVTQTRLAGFWYNQTKLVDGVCQETCRDLGHTQYGIAAIANAAETARIQGVDLFSEQAKRLAAGLEFNSQFLVGAPVPSWLCGGHLTAVTPDPTWDLAYNALANRLGLAMPNTKMLLAKIRPTGLDHHMAWETLTHGDIGSAGLP